MIDIIVGLGTDIVEISRVEKAIKNNSFVKRVYTDKEQEYCNSRGKGSISSYAGRFSAKEAVLKAFGTGLRNGELQEIEILNDELGAPKLFLHGYFKELAEKKGIKSSIISISHSREYAIAECIMQTEGGSDDL